MSTTRTKCIFCKNELKKAYFENDYENYVAHYQVNPEMHIDSMVKIPFNVCVCDLCNTAQTKYLGDLQEIYKINHADSTGQIMTSLHEKVKLMILKNKNNINNIIEIGSSIGVLADQILNDFETIYHIIEPCYYGKRDNKVIYDDFYENIDDCNINANTLIISHVFEHFYEPLEILKKISNNKNLQYFYLVFPDLEYYINNNILHVLNTEHTYYVDNKFLVNVIEKHGFELVEMENHVNHSVIFHFKKSTNESKNMLNITNLNYSLDLFYGKIFETIAKFNNIIDTNPNKKIYAWPASIHILYLCAFGLKYNKLNGLLDNSNNKIGKKMYGVDLIIESFNEKINENDKNTIILLNGGVFNNEILKHTKESNILFITDAN